MNNILLGLFLVGAAATWRRSGYWLPAAIPIGQGLRRRVLIAGGTITISPIPPNFGAKFFSKAYLAS